MIDLHSYGCHNHGANLLPIPKPTWVLINPPRYLHYDDYDDNENDDEDVLHGDDDHKDDDDDKD